MKFFSFYKKVLKCQTPDDVFSNLISKLKPSILLWSYFVNWEKVFQNVKKIEIGLKNLNYLIGKQNFDDEFKYLIRQNPSLVRTLPALAVRDGSESKDFKILIDFKNKKFVYEDYDFSKKQITEHDLDRCLTFIKETGLKNLLVNQKIKNLVDYMVGVEAGIDSNARKNRSGHFMENIVEYFIDDLCKKTNATYIKEANSKRIKKEWNILVPVDRVSRRFDFVINVNNNLIIVETNFYTGGGSKLKSTAGEYKNLFDIIGKKYDFLWITDGPGWEKALNPLRETFEHNDYIFSLSMLEKGILEFFIKNKNIDF